MEMPKFVWITTEAERKQVYKQADYSIEPHTLLVNGDFLQLQDIYDAITLAYNNLMNDPDSHVLIYRFDARFNYMNLLSWRREIKSSVNLFLESDINPDGSLQQIYTLSWHNTLPHQQRTLIRNRFFDLANSHLSGTCLPSIPQLNRIIPLFDPGV